MQPTSKKALCTIFDKTEMPKNGLFMRKIEILCFLNYLLFLGKSNREI